MSNYQIYKLRGRKIMAIPVAPTAVRLGALKRYQATTTKKRLIKTLVRLASTTGLRAIWPGKTDLSLECGLPFPDWVAHVREWLDRPFEYAFVVWPAQLDRGRLYVHLMDRGGDPVAFAKISLDSDNDRMLEQEAIALRHLAGRQFRFMNHPQVLVDGNWQDRTFLIVDPIPNSVQPVEPNMASLPTKCLEELQREPKQIEAPELSTLPWWQQCLNAASPHSCFYESLLDSTKNGIKVGHVHGDLGPGNILTDSQRVWIFDWEQSSQCGPIHTDSVNYYLAVNFSSFLSDPVNAADGMHRFFLDERSRKSSEKCCATRDEILVALAFLNMHGVANATNIIATWSSTKFMENDGLSG